ncbi:13441_t:CDS:2, partial [Cetraspora pellucida]
FDDESIHSESCSVSSKSTYISDDGFVVHDKQCLICNQRKCICISLNHEISNNYISKQNAYIINGGIPIFEDEELRMDDRVFDGYRSELLLYKETLEKMKKNGFTIDTVYTQLCSEMEININLLNDTKDSISKLEKEAREFSLLILVNNDKKVYISQRINPFKDYHGKYQVIGGKKESNESYLDCAIREAKEEAGVEIKIEDLNLIGTCEGFRVFPDSEGKQILYRTAIYFSITDQTLQHTEPKNHAEWIS